MANIPIDKLAAEITKAAQEYTDDITQAIKRKVDRVANEMIKDIKNDSPIKSGAYRDGFKKVNQDEYGKISRVIWNKNKPSMVHLLEFGHAKVNGGRVNGKPHLRPAFDKNIPKLEEGIKRIIKNGGGK